MYDVDLACQPPALPICPPSHPTTQPPNPDPPNSNLNSNTHPPPCHHHQLPPALSELQTQLHHTQSSLAIHIENVRALEGIIAEHDVIKREVGLLRQLVEK